MSTNIPSEESSALELAHRQALKYGQDLAQVCIAEKARRSPKGATWLRRGKASQGRKRHISTSYRRKNLYLGESDTPPFVSGALPGRLWSLWHASSVFRCSASTKSSTAAITNLTSGCKGMDTILLQEFDAVTHFFSGIHGMDQRKAVHPIAYRVLVLLSDDESSVFSAIAHQLVIIGIVCT